MPLNGLVVKDAATSMTVVGGSDLTFSLDGIPILSGVHVSASAVADFRLRPHMGFKYMAPKKLADGTWTRERWFLVFTYPELIDGVIKDNVIRQEVHMQLGSALKLQMALISAQILGRVAAGSQNYLSTGALA